jgi:hypothetical protein
VIHTAAWAHAWRGSPDGLFMLAVLRTDLCWDGVAVDEMPGAKEARNKNERAAS